MDVTKDPDSSVLIDYTNWRGERSKRAVIPQSIRFGISGWHTEPGWLMAALDIEKGEVREFAMADIHSWMSPIKSK